MSVTENPADIAMAKEGPVRLGSVGAGRRVGRAANPARVALSERRHAAGLKRYRTGARARPRPIWPPLWLENKGQSTPIVLCRSLPFSGRAISSGCLMPNKQLGVNPV
jgi:hypothetical protein